MSIPLTGLLLALTGCYNPHVITQQDALYCEKQGLRPGTDANYDCAMKHEDERVAAGGKAEDPPSDPSSLPGQPQPPSHAGGVRQITPRYIKPNTTVMINFAISVNNKCEFLALPTVEILVPPSNGAVQVLQHVDFARLAESGGSASCSDQKVPGVAVEYTPKKKLVGTDIILFRVTDPSGRTYFKVPLTIGNPDPDSDDDD
jgi:hypothetical protein